MSHYAITPTARPRRDIGVVSGGFVDVLACDETRPLFTILDDPRPTIVAAPEPVRDFTTPLTGEWVRGFTTSLTVKG